MTPCLHIFFYFSGIAFYTNAALNPFLYSLLSKRFRRGFHDLLIKIGCKSSSNTSQSNHNQQQPLVLNMQESSGSRRKSSRSKATMKLNNNHNNIEVRIPVISSTASSNQVLMRRSARNGGKMSVKFMKRNQSMNSMALERLPQILYSEPPYSTQTTRSKSKSDVVEHFL